MVMDIEQSLHRLCSIYQAEKPLLIIDDGNKCYYFKNSITLGKRYWWLCEEGCTMEDMLLHEFTHYLLDHTRGYVFTGHNDVFFNKLKEVIKKFRGDESNYPWPIEYENGQQHAAENNTYPGMMPSVSVGLRKLIGMPYTKGRRER